MTTTGVRVRSGPGTAYAILGQVNTGATFPYIKTVTGWFEIVYAGKNAYVADWLATLVSPAPPPSQKVYISASDVNLRSGPGLTYGVMGQASFGQSFPLLGTESGWDKIQLPSGVAFVAGWLVSSAPLPSGAPASAILRLTTLTVAHFRTGPSLSSSLITTLPKGSGVIELGSAGPWVKVAAGPRVGWIYGSLLSKPSSVTSLGTASTGDVGSKLLLSASASAAPVVSLPANQTYPILARTGAYVQIVTGWGVGWADTSTIIVSLFGSAAGSAGGTGGGSPNPVGGLPVDIIPGLFETTGLSYDSLPYLVPQTGGFAQQTDGYSATYAYTGTVALTPDQPIFDSTTFSAPSTLPIVMATALTEIRPLPATLYDIMSRPVAGTSLSYLGSKDGWIEVGLPNGTFGWDVAPDLSFAWPPGLSPQTVTATSDGWAVSHLSPEISGIAVESNTLGPLLDLQGTFSSLTPQLTSNGRGVFIPVANTAAPFSLPLNIQTMTSLTLTPQGILLLGEGLEAPTMVTNSAGHLVIQFRSVVEGESLTAHPDGTSLDLTVSGAVAPSVSRSGSSVVLTLPGTLAPVASLPPPSGTIAGLSMTESAEGTVITITPTAQGAVHLTVNPGQISLVVETPGLQGKVLVLDPGHGGPDSGAVGVGGIEEATINLAIGLQVAQDLQSMGAQVVLTRNSPQTPFTNLGGLTGYNLADQGLADRVSVAQQSNADLFLSIHNNASSYSGTEGTQTYYGTTSPNSGESFSLAQDLQSSVVSALGDTNGGTAPAPFYVVLYAPCPSALIEVGYVTNPQDAKDMQNPAWIQASALAIAQGIANYFQRP